MSESTHIEALSQEGRVIQPPAWVAERAYINSMEQYEEMYRRSIEDPEGFWGEMAEEMLHWHKKWDTVLDYEFDTPRIEWFKGGKLNVAYNCIDRHLNSWRRNKAAIIWESDEGRTKVYTYQSLYYKVCRFANVLKKHGIKKGDRVAIYLPMIPELPIAMLACARIGAIHSVVFGGFSSAALRDRIQDCGAKMLITADEGIRGGRLTPLKAEADVALLECPSIESVIVVSRARTRVDMEPGRDFWYHEEVRAADVGRHCDIEWMDAEDPLFILYTSGSTGKPKGVLHTTAGYLLYAATTFKYVFDYHDEDVFWCTADIGWVTGHSYIVYGPLAVGATTLMFEGVPTYPDPGRFWEIVEKHGVNQFYTAPTAIRALMKAGEEWPAKYDLSSLRVLGTVGEPINPEAWMWYYKNIGRERVPIVDTYWQTETGGHIITNLPGATPMKPGSATRPFFGIAPEVVNEDGSPTPVGSGGRLCITKPWPGMLRGTWGDPENKRVKEIYFTAFPGKYFTGDGARKDEDGYYWLLGRVDDVINVSGHRLGTAEVESALVSHPAVAEAAVVGYPHDVKGEGIYAYVILRQGQEPSESLAKILTGHVREEIGPIAKPDFIHFVPELPKTRSGKIMRRILRKIAAGERDMEAFGDISTLADPSIVQKILDTAPNA
ncbi:acetate--CoA ligase [Coriobacteriia bacterium Es71-Z0120]|uniref:acetate--CoA ligase n=1 Tax=Parvivirga hydrogeniphila TaxID=2939460 RepID=UPI00226090BE|nr:acetate--CoA ligase [Parvivirga hydrogeniphila]MCL4078921.1 acetate--CoA ligase [Parvivirga hydrogeniphila]